MKDVLKEKQKKREEKKKVQKKKRLSEAGNGRFHI